MHNLKLDLFKIIHDQSICNLAVHFRWTKILTSHHFTNGLNKYMRVKSPGTSGLFRNDCSYLSLFLFFTFSLPSFSLSLSALHRSVCIFCLESLFQSSLRHLSLLRMAVHIQTSTELTRGLNVWDIIFFRTFIRLFVYTFHHYLFYSFSPTSIHSNIQSHT